MIRSERARDHEEHLSAPLPVPLFHVKRCDLGVWTRGQVHSLNWGYNAFQIATVPAGLTLQRVRFQWGMWGVTPLVSPTAATATQLMVFGLYTTPSTVGGSPPSPYTSAGDPSPPMQRWVYWEARFPVIMGQVHGRPGAVQWRDSGAGQELSSKGMVLANVASPATLDVYMVWDVAAAWDSAGRAQFWGWSSTLYS